MSAIDDVDDFIPETSVPDIRRLRLIFADTNDASDPGAFSREHAETLLAFVDDLSAADAARFLVHCRAGIRPISLAGVRDRHPPERVGSSRPCRPITTRTFVESNSLVVWRLDEPQIEELLGALREPADTHDVQ